MSLTRRRRHIYISRARGGSGALRDANTQQPQQRESLLFKIWKMAWRLRAARRRARCLPLYKVYQFGLASTNKTQQKYVNTKFKKDKIVESRKLKISRVERVWRKTYPKPSCLFVRSTRRRGGLPTRHTDTQMGPTAYARVEAPSESTQTHGTHTHNVS